MVKTCPRAQNIPAIDFAVRVLELKAYLPTTFVVPHDWVVGVWWWLLLLIKSYIYKGSSNNRSIIPS